MLKINTHKIPWLIPFFILLFTLNSCNSGNDAPKPRGYFRFSFPHKAYTRFTSTDCPYSFEYPVYAKVVHDTSFFGAPTEDPCWLNVEIPELSGIIHISYKEIKGQNTLEKLIEDAHKLSYKHTVKADYIDETPVNNPEHNVKGLIYEIGGNAASNVQFYLTDSTHNFIRGALYFSAPPNADSLAPAVAFVKQDMLHLINTLEWK